MGKTLCFGEFLLRLSPELNGDWLHRRVMPAYIGGSELNVATALARWKVPVAYFSALPLNYLSKEICDHLQQKNIDTERIHFSGNRMGIYFLPGKADLKNAAVIYDRAHSSFSELQPGMIDWEQVLTGIDWLHLSAISPALTYNSFLVCRELMETASKKNISLSMDLNYRAKLWNYGRQPAEIMQQLVYYSNLVMGNIWSANQLLGIPVDAHIHENATRERYLEHAGKTADAIMRQFPTCKTVAQTFRFDRTDGGILYYGTINKKGEQYHSKELITANIADKSGSGDCFMAGLIYGHFHKLGSQDTVDFAAAAAFGKLHEVGDSTSQSVEDIKRTL